jgi:hypothetical protein
MYTRIWYSIRLGFLLGIAVTGIAAGLILFGGAR